MIDEDPTLDAGTLVDDRYRVKREIARGGMSLVLEAEHVVLGETVALKVLRGSIAELRSLRARVDREARALARARHPHIVGIRDAGTCPRFGPYLALQPLYGRPLDGLLSARGRIGVSSVLAIAREIGAALGHAHSVGVFHRDVKPGNVLIVPGGPGEPDTSVLIDFGIASVAEALAGPDPKLTRSGEVLGTPEYMAPELLLDGASPDARTDVYALAVTMYECLTGEVPHTGRMAAIMAALALERPPTPMLAARSDVPPALEGLLRRALSRDPAKRPAGPVELATLAIEACGQPVLRLELLGAHGMARRAAPPPVLTPTRVGDVVPPPSPPQGARRHVRAAYVAPARVIGGAGAFDGRTEDVSEGGALIAGTIARPEEGEVVSVRFPLPTSGRIVTLMARARWCRTHRGAHAIGVAFVDVPAAAREDIARYVELMAHRSGDPSTAVAPAREEVRAA